MPCTYHIIIFFLKCGSRTIYIFKPTWATEHTKTLSKSPVGSIMEMYSTWALEHTEVLTSTSASQRTPWGGGGGGWQLEAVSFVPVGHGPF